MTDFLGNEDDQFAGFEGDWACLNLQHWCKKEVESILYLTSTIHPIIHPLYPLNGFDLIYGGRIHYIRSNPLKG